MAVKSASIEDIFLVEEALENSVNFEGVYLGAIFVESEAEVTVYYMYGKLKGYAYSPELVKEYENSCFDLWHHIPLEQLPLYVNTGYRPLIIDRLSGNTGKMVLFV